MGLFLAEILDRCRSVDVPFAAMLVIEVGSLGVLGWHPLGPTGFGRRRLTSQFAVREVVRESRATLRPG